MSAFAICVEAIKYLLLYNLRDCTFNFSVEDHFVDIFYWFDKSSKQKSILKDYYNFCDHDLSGGNEIYFITLAVCRGLHYNRELKKYSVYGPIS